MIDTYDVKDSKTRTDKISDLYNRFYDAHLSGGLVGEELSEIFINFGDLFANKIKQGKATQDEIDSTFNYLSGFIGENKDNYFPFPHKGLDRASKTVCESVEFAKDEMSKRTVYTQPSMTQEERNSYTLGFRKLG